MKRSLAPALAACALAAACLAAPAPAAAAAFGLHDLRATISDCQGAPQTEAGTHPCALVTNIAFNTEIDPETGFPVPVEEAKDVSVAAPPGLLGDPTAVPRCDAATFLQKECPDASALGFAETEFGTNGEHETELDPVYNLYPVPGAVARAGLIVEGRVPVFVDFRVNPDPPHNVIASSTNTSQLLFALGFKLTLWGVPADPVHDEQRGSCLHSAKSCPGASPVRPFLTLPASCGEQPLSFAFKADSWEAPGSYFEATVPLTDGLTPPSALGAGACERPGFDPAIAAQPTNRSAAGPSGLDFSLAVEDPGLSSPAGTADSDIRTAAVTLPRGMTLNPAVAAGLAACSEADFARETAGSEPGQGCPQASKVGTVEVQTPLLEGVLLRGQVYVATPYANPTGSLIALYMVIRDPALGILVKLPGRVAPDPASGQLTTTFGEAPYEIPQFPFSHFSFHFREGARSPLVTPPACGEYETRATLTPWARPSQPLALSAPFEILAGVGGGPCPPPGPPPFDPGFEAGTAGNAAGRYSPLQMRLTRRDGDQDLTRFSAALPPGLVARLAGTAQCPEAAIALARSRSGPHGGAAELASPSCPADSRIGTAQAGAGVGSQLTYVPGKIYLAGPYNGAPLSAVAIVPAVAGPFDVGTVVTRQALRIDPRSARVTVDGAASDPIPHILAGIPLAVRDIRVSVDKPDFTLNPTSCAQSALAATLWGGGSALAPLPESPVTRSARFQASSCASLGFAPRLSLKLRGGTRRGAFPKLRGAYRPRPGDANLAKLVLGLPHSAFLEQGHFATICTRVQYAAGACPAKSVYGHARAFTPLLAQPLEGPVYLRSSSHNLPDLVASLHGAIDVEAVARIDSKHGGIRATFAGVPDAPLTKVVVNMQGGRKGLIVNSTDLCAAKHRADARYFAHNGRRASGRPPVRAAGCKHKRKRANKRRGR